jgi:hypothetical protein
MWNQLRRIASLQQPGTLCVKGRVQQADVNPSETITRWGDDHFAWRDGIAAQQEVAAVAFGRERPLNDLLQHTMTPAQAPLRRDAERGEFNDIEPRPQRWNQCAANGWTSRRRSRR